MKRHPKTPPTHSGSSDDASTSSTIEQNLIAILNSNKEKKTSRDLKLHKPYKVLELTVTEQQGFAAPYKLARAKLQGPGSKQKTIEIDMPKPITRLPDSALESIQKYINKSKYPTYIVNAITERPRSDGKGTYDVVDYVFK
jgi:hypothetical protein